VEVFLFLVFMPLRSSVVSTDSTGHLVSGRVRGL